MTTEYETYIVRRNLKLNNVLYSTYSIYNQIHTTLPHTLIKEQLASKGACAHIHTDTPSVPYAKWETKTALVASLRFPAIHKETSSLLEFQYPQELSREEHRHHHSLKDLLQVSKVDVLV